MCMTEAQGPATQHPDTTEPRGSPQVRRAVPKRLRCSVIRCERYYDAANSLTISVIVRATQSASQRPAR